MTDWVSCDIMGHNVYISTFETFARVDIVNNFTHTIYLDYIQYWKFPTSLEVGCACMQETSRQTNEGTKITLEFHPCTSSVNGFASRITTNETHKHHLMPGKRTGFLQK